MVDYRRVIIQWVKTGDAEIAMLLEKQFSLLRMLADKIPVVQKWLGDVSLGEMNFSSSHDNFAMSAFGVSYLQQKILQSTGMMKFCFLRVLICRR